MGVIVETTLGRVEGVQAESHQRFRGLRFAAPPVGDLRFHAPRPAKPWSNLHDAGDFGLSAPQNPSPLPGMAVGPQGEDCLCLNVYTPAADAGCRPVMVWIHGGGFTAGSGSQALYDGGPLAVRGDVVVVTVNYRLGALGYLNLKEFGGEAAGASANVGQLDQIVALEWARDNAASFGGDPHNVTIFGESAGGMAVSTLLAMPQAAGLFRRAIAQSGVARSPHNEESATRAAEALLSELGLAGGEVARLREVPVAKLLEAQANVMLKLGRLEGRMPFAPMIDGKTLPLHPLKAVSEGAARDVPLVVGTNLEESKLFELRAPEPGTFDEARLLKRLRAQLGGHAKRADAIVDAYRRAREGRASTEPRELIHAIESDLRFRVPSIRLAEAQSTQQRHTYMYLFCWRSPARRGWLGACHALELPFVFGTLDAPTMDRFAGTGPDAEALSEQMMDSWIAFAHYGDPGCDSLPDWERYDAERRATMTFDRKLELVYAPLDGERATWDGIV